MRRTDASEQRSVRVFVSSTFRDMQAERDYLVKFSFPELRKVCEARGVTWAEVDLRWGIPDEKTAEGQLLPICFREIDRCRPYFIGLLANRYGWIPDSIPAELVQAHPWLAMQRNASVTALEIFYAVLRDPRPDAQAFFYFREESPDETDSLKVLKQVIRKAARAGVCRLRERYGSAEQLGQWVLNDFRALINTRFPHAGTPDLDGEESALHEAFARTRRAVYIGRAAERGAIRDYVARDHGGRGLAITGNSGAGKTALLANYESEDAITHFVGASPASTDPAAMLRRLLTELKWRYRLDISRPEHSGELIDAFANAVNMASAVVADSPEPFWRGLRHLFTRRRASPIVMIIDGLNQLDSHDHTGWLPPVIPENVRLIVSTVPGATLDELRKRGWTTLTVQPMRVAERAALIQAYLRRYGKELSAAHTRRISNAEQTANPLYLRSMLEELRVFGEHEPLGARLAWYLEAATVPALFQRILERYEADYGAPLVRDAMCLLWASRGGLTEAELLNLLGSNGQPLPRARWSPLYLAAEASLVDRGGLLSFFHEHIGRAVEDRYGLAAGGARPWHLRLASYFEAAGGDACALEYWRSHLTGKTRDELETTMIPLREFAESRIPRRKIDQLPRQLAQAREWPRLRDLLVDPDFLSAAWKRNPAAVLRCWAELESAGYDATEAYEFVLTDAGQCSWWALRAVLRLLDERGQGGRLLRALCASMFAELPHQLFVEAMQHDRELAEWVFDLWSRETLADVTRDNVSEAVDRLQQLARISAGLGYRRSFAALNVLLAQVTAAAGADADALLDRAEQEAKEIHDDGLLETVLSARAEILLDRGDADGSLALLERQQRICRRLGRWHRLAGSLNDAAAILLGKRQLEDAMCLSRRAETLAREHGLQVELASSLIHQAVAFERRGVWRKALACLDEAAEIYRSQLAREPLDRGAARVLAELEAMRSMIGRKCDEPAGSGDDPAGSVPRVSPP